MSEDRSIRVKLIKGKECKHSIRFDQLEDPIKAGVSTAVYMQKDTFKEMGEPSVLSVEVKPVKMGD